MKTFNDKNKKAWRIELTVGSARRVKADTGIDLVNIVAIGNQGKASSEALEKLIDDPFALVDVLYSLCAPQAEKENVGPEAFAELFDAPAIEAATTALVEEIINFFPPTKKKAVEKIYKIAQEVAAKNEAKLTELLNSPELEKEIENKLSSLSINAPE